jgi:hypothetical protein
MGQKNTSTGLQKNGKKYYGQMKANLKFLDHVGELLFVDILMKNICPSVLCLQ